VSVRIEYQALSDLVGYVDAFPEAARTAARIALNDVTEDQGLKQFREAIEAQVDFGPGYINIDRLGITSRAKNEQLRVVVTGRHRATSLARFAKGQSPVSNVGVQNSARQRGVRVKVKAGGATKTIRSGFLVKLNRGSAGIRDGFNVGLAVRLKPGERLLNKTKHVQLDNNVVLLYGPSVDQVFRDVAVDETPALLPKIESEYFRQFFRLTKNAK
jgi:hypothetical protein